MAREGSNRVDLRLQQTPLRRAIAAAFPASLEQGWIDFSESLGGPITDPDLGVWLSIIAASRVLGPEKFSKLARLPLHRFENPPPGSSAIYVLAGLEERQLVRIGVGVRDEEVKWSDPRPVGGFPGLVEYVEQVPDGGLVIALDDGTKAATCLASFAFPNRATVMTVTARKAGLNIQQLILPIEQLVPYLEPDVRDRLPDRPLRAVKFVTQAQRLLARRASLEDAMTPTEEWYSALYGKWLDPMMAIVACYELLRRGRGERIDPALDNLRKYFADLPDTAALIRLRGNATVPKPRWPPLVVDGFSAFPGGTFKRVPEGRLDFGGLWTSWRTATRRV